MTTPLQNIHDRKKEMPHKLSGCIIILMIAAIEVSLAQDTQPASQPDATLTSKPLDVPANKTDAINFAQLSSDGQYLVMTTRCEIYEGERKSVQYQYSLQNRKTGEITHLGDMFPTEQLKTLELRKVQFAPEGHLLLVTCLALSENGNPRNPPSVYNNALFVIDVDKNKVYSVGTMKDSEATWAGKRILIQSNNSKTIGSQMPLLVEPLTGEKQELPVYGGITSATRDGSRLLLLADPEKPGEKTDHKSWMSKFRPILIDDKGKVIRKIPGANALDLTQISPDGRYAYIIRTGAHIDDKGKSTTRPNMQTKTDVISLSDDKVIWSVESPAWNVMLLSDDTLLVFKRNGIFRCDAKGAEQKLCADAAIWISASGTTLLYRDNFRRFEGWRTLELPAAVK